MWMAAPLAEQCPGAGHAAEAPKSAGAAPAALQAACGGLLQLQAACVMRRLRKRGGGFEQVAPTMLLRPAWGCAHHVDFGCTIF